MSHKGKITSWAATKETLPQPTTSTERIGWTKWQKVKLVGLLAAVGWVAQQSCCDSKHAIDESHLQGWLETASHDTVDWTSCPHQPEALHPRIKWDVDANYRNHSADLLSAAIVCLFYAGAL